MKYAILFLVIVSIVLCAAFLPKNAPGGEFSPGSLDLSGADRLKLTNCHNGCTTYITNPDTIASVIGFLNSVVGTHPESGKGYYEGSYELTLCRDEKELLSLVFGDTDCFYTGKGPDGYPLRYLLADMTIKKDIIPFFSPYDASGSVRN